MNVLETCFRRICGLVGFLTLAMLIPAIASATDPVTHPATDQISVSQSYYSAIRFNWTDADGVTHESALTDRATDPAHIVALLREVYSNPAVPGYTHDASAGLVNDGREPYATVPYEPATQIPYLMDPDTPVETPVSGATALLVELKDSYGSNILDPVKAIDAIEAVSLISKQMYIGTEDGSTNPGFLFNVEGTLNKFFIITKGSIRPLERSWAPFYDMYEEFSPSNKSPIYDAFQQMDDGMQFPVDHNCSTIIGQRHDIIMSPQGKDHHYPVNMFFFLPDYRFLGETRFQKPGTKPMEHYTFYVPDHMPYFFFNKINAEIDAPVDVDPVAHKAKVPVKWVSTYKDITRSNVPERFLVYRVVNDLVESEPLPASVIETRQDDTTLLPDGSLVRSVSHDVMIYVHEEQEEYSRNVTYLIKGRRHNSEFSFIESNTVTAEIPGYSKFENLSIVAAGTPVSVYDIHAQVNRYSNAIDLTDTPSPTGQRLLNGHITVKNGDRPGTKFELRRYLPGDADGTLVATMEVTEQQPDKTWTGDQNQLKGVHIYEATITYPDGVDTTGLPLQTAFKSEMDRYNPANDINMPVTALDGADGVLARFVDRFEASTLRGEQPRSYVYRIIHVPAVDTAGENGNTVSNPVTVSIPVHEIVAGYIPYSVEEITADTEAADRLPVNPVGVAITTAHNPGIARYEVVNVTRGTTVAYALRNHSGTLDIFATADNGASDESLNPPTGEGYTGKLPIRLNSTARTDDMFALVVYYENGNSYGNVFSRLTALPMPRIDISTLAFDSSLDTNDTNVSYNASVIWESGGLSVRPRPEATPGAENPSLYEIAGYSVWGLHSGVTDYELLRALAPEAVAPMSESDEEILSHNFVSHKATAQNPVDLDHIVRLYAKVPADMLIASDDTTEGYVVNDDSAHLKLDSIDHIATGIENVGADSEADAEYYDLQGRVVASPGPGVYIRRTGATVEKVIIR